MALPRTPRKPIAKYVRIELNVSCDSAGEFCDRFGAKPARVPLILEYSPQTGLVKARMADSQRVVAIDRRELEKALSTLFSPTEV